MDTICAMTRSVRDAILTHEILAARTVARSSRSLSSYRLAVPTHLMLDGMEAGVQKAWERSLSRLSQAGARIVELPLFEIKELAGLLATGGFSAAESYTWHRHLLEKDAAGYDPRVLARIVRGANMKAFEYLDAPVLRVGGLDSPIPFSPILEKQFMAKSRLREKLDYLLRY